VVIHIIKHRYS